MPFPRSAVPLAPSRPFDRLRTVLSPAERGTAGQLLGRFLATRDEAAFAELVRRFGPMVLGVCRRGVGDPHLAEDAFQATFLVLARKAAAVRPRGRVAGYLYGVAVRTAREARTVLARTRRRETGYADGPGRPTADPDRDALAVLDEEIARLPDQLRAAVVACELDGRPRRDVAAELGIPEGTLSSRLAKGRSLLGRRLRSRGVAAPTILIATSIVPPNLAAETVRVVSEPTLAPSAVAALAAGVSKMMLVTRLATAIVVASSLALGLFYAPSAPAHPIAPPPKPAANPGRITVWAGDKLATFNPDGGDLKTTDAPLLYEAHWPIRIFLAPDGKSMVYRREDSTAATHLQLTLVDAPIKKGDGESFALNGYVVARYQMTPDAKTVYFSGPKGDSSPENEHTRGLWAFDRATKKVTRVPGTDRQSLIAVAGNGKAFLTFHVVNDNGKMTGVQTRLIPGDGSAAVEVFGPKQYVDYAALSPDGAYVVASLWEYERIEPLQSGGFTFLNRKNLRIVLWDVAKKTEVSFRTPYKEGQLAALGLSPDGSKVAIAWQDKADAADFDPVLQAARKKAADERAAAGFPRDQSAPIGPVRVSVSDLDGSNPREVYKSPKGRLHAFEWR
jgi:RNA polymerase sigma factor (sigma-70 family)